MLCRELIGIVDEINVFDEIGMVSDEIGIVLRIGWYCVDEIGGVRCKF